MRTIASQNADWGVHSLFQIVPNNLLLDEKMPSPNTTREQYELRFAVLTSCQLQWLSAEDDGDLLVSIKHAIARGPNPSHRVMQRNVEVATMRR